jgi:hypothetical protein
VKPWWNPGIAASIQSGDSWDMSSLFRSGYFLVNVYVTNWKITMFNG